MGTGAGEGDAGRPAKRFLSCLALAARQAGAVARHLRGEVGTGEKAGEATPESAALTAVDLAAQDLILLALRDAMPEAAVDAEEETSLPALFPPEDGERPVVVVDPIDGTFNYAHGSTDYAVMAGLIRAGRFEAAVVAFPEEDLLLAGRHGGPVTATRGVGPADAVRAGGPPGRVLVTPRVPAAARERLLGAGLEVDLSRCSAVDATAPLTARAGAAVSSPGLDRRRALALFLSAAAGASVLVDGRPWDGEDPGRGGLSAELVVVAADAGRARWLTGLLS